MSETPPILAPTAPRDLLNLFQGSALSGFQASTRDWKRQIPRLTPPDMERFHRAWLWQGDRTCRELVLAMERTPAVGGHVDAGLRGRVLSELYRQALTWWLAKGAVEGAAGPGPVAPPPRGPNVDALRTWAREHGVEAALVWRASVAGIPRDRASVESWLRERSLLEVGTQCAEVPASAGRRPVSGVLVELADQALAVLHELAVDVRRVAWARVAESEAHAARGADAGATPSGSAQVTRALVDAADHLAARGGFLGGAEEDGGEGAAVPTRIVVPPDLVAFGAPTLDGRTRLVLGAGWMFRWGAAPVAISARVDLRREGRRAQVAQVVVDGDVGLEIEGVLQQAVLRYAAAALRADGEAAGALRSTLDEAWDPSPWARALTRLDEALHHAEAAEGQLGWRLTHADGVVELIEPVRVQAGTRGRDRLVRLDPEAAWSLATLGRERDLVLRWTRHLDRLGGLVGSTELLPSLIGLPRVYAAEMEGGRAKVTGPLAVVRTAPELLLSKERAKERAGEEAGDEGAGDVLRLDVRIEGRTWPWAALLRALPTEDRAPVGLVESDRVLWLDAGPVVRSLVAVFGGLEGEFPASLLPDLVRRLPGLGRHTWLELDETVALDEVVPDTRLQVTLEQLGASLQLAAVVRAVPGGPAWPPGEGPASVFVHADETVVQARRNLVAEAQSWRGLWHELGLDTAPRDGLVQLDGVGAAVRALRVLRDHPSVVVSWVGQPVRVRRGRVRDLAMRLAPGSGARSGRGGLDLFGAIKTEDGEVSLPRLLEAVRAGEAFIPLGDGAWLELEDAVRTALEPLSRIAEPGKGDVVGVAQVHAPIVEEIRLAGAELDAPQAWFDLMDRMEQVRDLVPEPPAGLVDVLRPYQVEGFRWMTRLAAWANGAVLADDMGLGKTVQTLSWLQWHAHHGPALVVAPTSVCANWLSEMAKFTPELRGRLYHGPERAAALEGIGPGDVVVTSYALVARDGERLGRKGWAQVVLDEAQHIKNADTARARAVAALPADRRVALTGTPLENHTGELWAVMSAVLPGLLGSWPRFRERFAIPIERDGDAGARSALARLVRPFMLRRLKREVERDLPDRIEVTVPVTLSPGERVFYHGLREAALRSFTETPAGTPGRIHVLAAITRLRRAACDARLIDPSLPLTSSKLQRLREMVSTLRESGHRMLIFSQFVGLLQGARRVLEADGVTTGWLDGSTPAGRRVEEVAAFQAGQYDAFLISLKAGGTGLNLTAADVVVHLDPWWNPAVEDQATDRAHRIGQTRNVTVYRLVAQDTIEQAILGMHEAKRSLVADVLEGTGQAGGLSTDELVDLLRQAASPILEDEDEGPVPAELVPRLSQIDQLLEAELVDDERAPAEPVREGGSAADVVEAVEAETASALAPSADAASWEPSEGGPSEAAAPSSATSSTSAVRSSVMSPVTSPPVSGETAGALWVDDALAGVKRSFKKAVRGKALSAASAEVYTHAVGRFVRWVAEHQPAARGPDAWSMWVEPYITEQGLSHSSRTTLSAALRKLRDAGGVSGP
jgi:superfamily II DNA or RNA helicase